MQILTTLMQTAQTGTMRCLTFASNPNWPCPATTAAAEEECPVATSFYPYLSVGAVAAAEEAAAQSILSPSRKFDRHNT